jgi:2,5-diamino-6-(ribosylamino)-4(3H)-pyrimidinone 5'-phosphate reductase
MRPKTTLFLLVSVDGKISTGDTDVMDIDKDYPQVPGLNEGLKQYYDLEQETDLFSLNTGRVFAKVGVNEKVGNPIKTPVSFVVIDNKPHLTTKGISFLSKKAKKLILCTTNKFHPAFSLQEDIPNLHVLNYDDEIDFNKLFCDLKREFEVDKLTIQSGGTLNATLLRLGLIDRVLLIVAPALIGGKNTASLIDGESLHSSADLFKIKTLQLIQARPLKNSYLLLEYNVLNGF